MCYLFCESRDIAVKDASLIEIEHSIRPEFLAMSELNDNTELQAYSSAVLHVISAIAPPPEFVELVAESFISSIRSSTVSHKDYPTMKETAEALSL